MEKEYIDWVKTERLIKELGNKIIDSGFKPTMIAAVPRGGWCVAALLAQILEIKETVGISHKKENGNITTYLATSGNLENERVLLIEDSIETGNTMYNAENELIKLGADVKTVAIFASSISEPKKLPDFYLDKRGIPDFPWEL